MQKDQQKLAELIRGKKVAFIGAGVSHKTLIKEFGELGAHVTLCDQKKSVEEFGDYAATIRELGIDLSLGEHYLDGFKGQDIIMRTPGFVGYFEKPLQDAMAAGTMVTSEVELFFDFCPCEIVAVTGSDGKTTTTTLISKFYEAAGRKVGMIGTNGIYYMGRHKDTANTTPESYELQKTFREFLDAGCDTALMEVSSQGLMMDRVAGVHYDVGVFTNLSPDHIGPGEHKTFEEYRSWKGQLFKRCDVGVVNIDDENTAALLEGHTCKLVTYGRDEKADYRETGYKLLRTHDFLGVAFHVTGKDEMDVKVNMPGEFSVYNALAALAVGKVLGLPDAAIHDGLGKCVVKGRVELVPISKKFTILLDYAHNEVSTESLLTTLRAYKPHRLVVVFGCGGNRSKLRRYGMGEICAKMADFSILTEDNNRFEKVEDIIADIREGMNKGNPDAKFVEIPDRLDALHYAVDHAQEGDLIAVIGKGHETYRDREGVKTPFLERELLEEYAQQIGLE